MSLLIIMMDGTAKPEKDCKLDITSSSKRQTKFWTIQHMSNAAREEEMI